jgi:hypothetical protein
VDPDTHHLGERAGDDGPTAARRAAPLTRRERLVVVGAGLVPLVVALVVLGVVAGPLGAGPGEVVVAALVYGGLLGLAVAFVAVDRLQARQCPRCQQRVGRGPATCPVCGYDLATRPRYACDERHRAYLDPGLCACGRRLHLLPAAQGLGRQVVFMLKLGAWLLALLLGIGVLLQVLDL